jgi:hypothetical protein
LIVDATILGLPELLKKMPGYGLVQNPALGLAMSDDRVMARVPVLLSLTKKIAPPPSRA